ncbi:MAG: helix-turn-helix domain-containing protein [bacterium]|nr:helix-turn-helix domain-containing protein [bacterium]
MADLLKRSVGRKPLVSALFEEIAGRTHYRPGKGPVRGSPRTVYGWRRCFRSGGIEALRPKRRKGSWATPAPWRWSYSTVRWRCAGEPPAHDHDAARHPRSRAAFSPAQRPPSRHAGPAPRPLGGQPAADEGARHSALAPQPQRRGRRAHPPTDRPSAGPRALLGPRRSQDPSQGRHGRRPRPALSV